MTYEIKMENVTVVIVIVILQVNCVIKVLTQCGWQKACEILRGSQLLTNECLSFPVWGEDRTMQY